MKKQMFISYSELDKNKMRSFERLIVNTKFLSPIIIADKREPLVQLSEKVKKGIIACDYFIPILTRNSYQNQWVNQEIGFATAIERPVIPIIESPIMDLLKGFINKNLDLSYSFISNVDNPKSEASLFTKCARLLTNDLLIQNHKIPESLTIENLFPGKWRSSYSLNGKQGGDIDIEIRNGNQYFVRGKHYFNLEEVEIDTEGKTLKFRKVGAFDTRRAYNELKILDLGKKYQGIENSNLDITYWRVR